MIEAFKGYSAPLPHCSGCVDGKGMKFHFCAKQNLSNLKICIFEIVIICKV
ncbi:hypothetical protein AHAS_Ahas04G0013800 [Arachis hypogaea]